MKGHKLVGVWGIVVLVLLILCSVSYAEQVVEVYVNGKKIVFPDQQPFVDEVTGRTYVPVRFVSKALGAQVMWKAPNVYIYNNGKNIRMTVNSSEITVNSQKKIYGCFTTVGERSCNGTTSIC